MKSNRNDWAKLFLLWMSSNMEKFSFISLLIHEVLQFRESSILNGWKVFELNFKNKFFPANGLAMKNHRFFGQFTKIKWQNFHDLIFWPFIKKNRLLSHLSFYVCLTPCTISKNLMSELQENLVNNEQMDKWMDEQVNGQFWIHRTLLLKWD